MDDTLIKEYFHLQEVVEEFDSKSLTIKAWSVTLSMTRIGAAYSQEKPIILFLAGISALLFWLTEGLWKTFQQAYYARMRGIENYWAGNESDMKPLQIATSWSKSWHEGGVRHFFACCYGLTFFFLMVWCSWAGWLGISSNGARLESNFATHPAALR